MARPRVAYTSAKCPGAEDEGYNVFKDKAVTTSVLEEATLEKDLG